VARGARSLRGALGAYAAAGAAAVLALALVLWWGGPRPEESVVTLRAGGACTGAVLDDGQRRHELRPGGALRLPPGRYRVTLLDAAGAGALLELDLPPGATQLPP
jgi:hypothetical protein